MRFEECRIDWKSHVYKPLERNWTQPVKRINHIGGIRRGPIQVHYGSILMVWWPLKSIYHQISVRRCITTDRDKRYTHVKTMKILYIPIVVVHWYYQRFTSHNKRFMKHSSSPSHGCSFLWKGRTLEQWQTKWPLQRDPRRIYQLSVEFFSGV